MKNFLIVGLVVISLLIGTGCGSYVMSSGKDRFGNVHLTTGSPVWGRNEFFGTLKIINNTSYPFYVFQGAYVVSRESDKKTETMVGPHAHFYTEDNGVLVGGGSSWIVSFRDPTGTRTVREFSYDFTMRIPGGVINNTWEFWEEKGQIIWKTYYTISNIFYGGFYR